MRAADHPFFGRVGGRHYGRFTVSELDVSRGERAVWDMNGTLGPGSISFPSIFPEDCWAVLLVNHTLSGIYRFHVDLVRWRGYRHH